MSHPFLLERQQKAKECYEKYSNKLYYTERDNKNNIIYGQWKYSGDWEERAYNGFHTLIYKYYHVPDDNYIVFLNIIVK